MAWPTQWTWVWVNSGSWWWTGRPGVLRFMGSQWVRHDWVTELNWTEYHLKGFPGGSVVESPPPNAGDAGSISALESCLEKEMTTCSSFLACKIPQAEEPGWLQPMGSQSVGHDLVTEWQQISFKSHVYLWQIHLDIWQN